MRTILTLLLSAGLHAQTLTLPTNPPSVTPPREQVCAELFSDPPKRICTDKATTANPDTRIAKLEVDLAIVVETLELQLKAIHALLAKIEALEATNKLLIGQLEQHRKAYNHTIDDLLASLMKLWDRINKMEEKRK